MTGRQGDDAGRWLAGCLALVGILEAVGDGVLREMEQRIHDLLDDAGVELDALAAGLDPHALGGGPGCLLALAREARVQAADRHQPRATESGPHLAGEPVYETDVLPDGAAERGQLGVDLGDIGRDLGHAAGEEREVVIAVELELGEELSDRAGPRVLVLEGAAGAPGRQPRLQAPALHVGHRLSQPCPAREQDLAQAVDLAESALERAARDHELADQIHQTVETIERDADGLASHAGRRGLPPRGADRRRHRHPGAGRRNGGRRLERLGFRQDERFEGGDGRRRDRRRLGQQA
jgi:hypothetical protein